MRRPAVHDVQRAARAARPGRRAAQPRWADLHGRRGADHPGWSAGPGSGGQAGPGCRGHRDHRGSDLPRRPDRLQPVRADVRRGADGRAGHGHRPPGAGARRPSSGQDDLHGAGLPEPDRGHHEPAPAAPADRAGQRVRGAGRRGHALSRPALRRGAPADPEEPGHAGPGASISAASPRSWPPGCGSAGPWPPRSWWSSSGCSSWPPTPRAARSNMAATSAYLTRYDIEAHIASVLPVYRRKRDLMLATMAATFPASVSFTRPGRRPVHLADLPRRVRRRRLHGRAAAARGQDRLRARRHLLPGHPAAEPCPGQLLGRARRRSGARHHPLRRAAARDPGPARPGQAQAAPNT